MVAQSSVDASLTNIDTSAVCAEGADALPPEPPLQAAVRMPAMLTANNRDAFETMNLLL